MHEFDKLYTVEDIAIMTSFTTRTIRNYLKDGNLKGKKIGGQWRFTMENVEQLFNNDDVAKNLKSKKKLKVMSFIDGVNANIQNKIRICTIIDYYCEDQNASKLFYEKLVTIINENDDHVQNSTFDFEFSEQEKKARVTIIGNPDYIIKTLNLL
jgi:nitrogenase subunit NifH